jgi:hypothetical protein
MKGVTRLEFVALLYKQKKTVYREGGNNQNPRGCNNQSKSPPLQLRKHNNDLFPYLCSDTEDEF